MHLVNQSEDSLHAISDMAILAQLTEGHYRHRFSDHTGSNPARNPERAKLDNSLQG